MCPRKTPKNQEDTSSSFSSVIIILHLPREHHHPSKQHGSDDLERESGLPQITDGVLRQPGQRVDADAFARLVGDVGGAVGAHVARAVELDRRFDERGQPEDEEDKRRQQDYAGN